MSDQSENRFRLVPFSPEGLRSVLSQVLENFDKVDGYAVANDARVWLEAYDTAPDEEGWTNNVPNRYLVGMQGEHIVMSRRTTMFDKQGALELAVWLSVLADPLDEKFFTMRRAAMQS